MEEEENDAIGIDLGATKIRFAIVNFRGKICRELTVKTNVKGGYPSVLKQVIKGINELKENWDRPLGGIGIGVAGQVDSLSGSVIFGPNLDWHHVPLKTDVEQALKLPVFVLNDVQAITWGEWFYGAGKGCENFVCLFIGTGIGGGIVNGGKLYTGCSGSAGEIGHLVIDFNGVDCTCGGKGCFEAYAGGWGIARMTRDYFQKEKAIYKDSLIMQSVHGNQQAISAKIVCEAYSKGDILAKKIINEVQKALIAGCCSLVNVLNPCMLIIGGKILDSIPEMLGNIRMGVKKYALSAPMKHLEILGSTLKNDAGVIGAVAFVCSKYKDSKGSKSV